MLAPEEPLCIDASGDGRLAVLDRGGLRLLVEGGEPVELAEPAMRCRFCGGELLLLFADGLLKGPHGERRYMPGPLDFAVAPSGSVYLSYPGYLERLGEIPLHFEHEDCGVLAVESGGVWVAGERTAALLRPVPGGLELRERIHLPAPARAAAVGPDGALCVLCGDELVRGVAPPIPLERRHTGLARCGKRLMACGPDGLVDLTHFVPPAEGDGPRFELPSCSA